MLVPDRRTLIVLASLVGAMTVASGLLLVLEPGPATAAKGISLSSIGQQRRVHRGLFVTSRQAKPGRWSTVVVHYGHSSQGHSSQGHSSQGSSRATVFQAVHGAATGQLAQDEGYHFVIRNDSSISNEQLEIGQRWIRQQAGAYWAGTESHWVNHHGIGICIENNPTGQGPTEEQLRKAVWLVQRLQVEFHIPADRVILQVDTPPATSKSRWFPVAWFRQQLLAFSTP